MIGYEVIVDELEKTNEKGFLFALPEEIGKNILFRPRLRSMSNMQGSKSRGWNLDEGLTFMVKIRNVKFRQEAGKAAEAVWV